MFKKKYAEIAAVRIEKNHLHFKNIRLKGINLVHVIIVICLILMISIRLLSDFDKNRIIMNEISKSNTIETLTAIHTEAFSENTNEVTTEKSTDSTVEPSTNINIKNENNEVVNNETQVAYSAELDKTFTISEFSNLTKEEYMTFPGIGEVTAQRILDYIAESGPFESFDEIMEVKGIGEKKLEKLMNILP